MQNELWEQVIDFLSRLRCENVSRDTAVEITGYDDTQKKLEKLRETCKDTIQHLPQEEQRQLVEWIEKLEDMVSLEGQKAYCQGYVDCILLLSGFRLFRQDISPEEIMKQIQ